MIGVFPLLVLCDRNDVGWHRAERMGISTVVLYDSEADEYFSYMEDEIDEFIIRLRQLPLVIGFNNKRFDNQVLSAYTSFYLTSMPTIDILEEVRARLGYRLSLDRLARYTLGVQKTVDGLHALRWYKEGRMADIIRYCEMDVRITKDLFLFGKKRAIFSSKTRRERDAALSIYKVLSSARLNS